MARKAGVVTINLNAGTAQFFADMDRTNAKLREFGQAGVSEARAVHAGLKVIEGGFANNTRAAAAFLEKIVGIGPIMQIAFPVVGALAFAGVLTEGAKKAYEFYKTMAEGPARISAAFRELNAPLRLTNDELALSNVRLANDLAALDGKPKNMLAVALHEAVVEADKLADSLAKDIVELNQMLDKKAVADWKAFIFGQGGTGYLKEEFGGDTGTGFPERVEAIRAEGEEALKLAVQYKDLGAADKARLETTSKLLAAYYAELKKVDEWERQAKDRAKDRTVTGAGFAGGFATVRGTDERANLDALAGIRDRLQREIAEIDQRANAGAMGEKKTLGEGVTDLSNQGRPFANELAKLQAQLAGVRGELAAVGQDHAFQVQARATAAANEELARLAARLKDAKDAPLTPAKEGQIRSLFGDIEAGKDQVAWGQKIDATVRKLRDETHEQELLTAAVGKGYAAIRDASIEAAVMKSMGPERYDKDSADAARIRAAASAEYDAKHRAAQAEVLLNLREQIGLERSLAVAQAAGAAAVREAELQAKVARMELAGATKANIDAEKELAAAKHATAIAADVAKIDEQTAATERLTAAIGKGAAAVRGAMLANRLAEIEREGDIPVPGIVGIGQRGLAAIGADSADRAKQVAEAAARADRVQAIDDEIGKLEEAKATRGDTLAIEMQLRDLQQQRIKALAEETVSLGGARDGVRAFFVEMQEQARTSASIIYEALNSALDKTSENFMKLMTGQGKRSDWGKEFKGIGDQMAESFIKSLMQKGLGVAGEKLGASAANPMWVRLAGATPALAMPGGGSMPAGGAGGGSFWSSLLKPFGIPGGGGGSSSPGDTNTLDFGGWMAEGGDVDPGHVYGVGDKGIEYFQPSTRGRLIPESALGTTNNFYSNVDARGADLGMANRIHRAIDDAHRNAVSTAIQGMHERSRRVPRQR